MIFVKFSIKNCLLNPNFVVPCLKLFIDGIKIWKNLIGKINEFLTNLLFIYFNYSEIEISNETMGPAGANAFAKTAVMQMITEFDKQDIDTKKRMKKMIIL